MKSQRFKRLSVICMWVRHICVPADWSVLGQNNLEGSLARSRRWAASRISHPKSVTCTRFARTPRWKRVCLCAFFGAWCQICTCNLSKQLNRFDCCSNYLLSLSGFFFFWQKKQQIVHEFLCEMSLTQGAKKKGAAPIVSCRSKLCYSFKLAGVLNEDSERSKISYSSHKTGQKQWAVFWKWGSLSFLDSVYLNLLKTERLAWRRHFTSPTSSAPGVNPVFLWLRYFGSLIRWTTTWREDFLKGKLCMHHFIYKYSSATSHSLLNRKFDAAHPFLLEVQYLQRTWQAEAKDDSSSYATFQLFASLVLWHVSSLKYVHPSTNVISFLQVWNLKPDWTTKY